MYMKFDSTDTKKSYNYPITFTSHWRVVPWTNNDLSDTPATWCGFRGECTSTSISGYGVWVSHTYSGLGGWLTHVIGVGY